jgi:hypothetical protein
MSEEFDLDRTGDLFSSLDSMIIIEYETDLVDIPISEYELADLSYYDALARDIISKDSSS